MGGHVVRMRCHIGRSKRHIRMRLAPRKKAVSNAAFVGITGSSGKPTTMALLALAEQDNVARRFGATPPFSLPERCAGGPALPPRE
jgi:hypothetical protein